MKEDVKKVMEALNGLSLRQRKKDVITLAGYAQPNRICYSDRTSEHISENGADTTEHTKYIAQLHCGCFCNDEKTLGRMCKNQVPRHKKKWAEDYHIVCKACLVPEGCSACGCPGDKICFTKLNGQWYCTKCLKKFQWVW